MRPARQRCETLQHGWRVALQLRPHACPQSVDPRCGGTGERNPQDGDGPIACRVEYNDSQWFPRSVPHDFTTETAPNVEEATASFQLWSWWHRSRTRENPSLLPHKTAKRLAEMTGSLPLGQAWYRRWIVLPGHFNSESWLEFDGVMVAFEAV